MIRLSAMRVRFWGTRGSIAAPGPNTARFGGNTSCVEVRASDGTVIILDCGTGARELGLHLVDTMPQPIRLHLFIGHTHWDHIQGFPFFVPAFLPGSELNIYAPIGFQRGLEEAMAGQMEYSYFPVKMRDLRSRIHFTELDEGFFRVGSVLVETQFLNHTAPTIAYRMTGDGATIAYATDHEPFWNASGRVSQHPGDERHIAFLKGANLVIHDAQYTDAEYRDKVGWGHSSLEYAVDIALAAGVERLVLFHHDPAHNDAMLEQMEGMARAHVDRRGQALDVLAAREGLALEVRGSSAEPDMEEASALQHRQIVGGRVLVISANDPEVAEIEEVLGDDRLVFLHETDVASVLTRGLEHPPDIAIIDRELLDGRDDTVLDTLRHRLGRRNLPIIVLADSSIPPDAVYRGEASSTDYLSKPFSPPMLRTRVRAWLARTLLVLDSIERRAPRAADTTSTSESDSHTASPLDMVPLFGSLTPDQRDRLLVSAMERTFAPGQVLIRENDPPDRLFVILSGRVRVMEVAPDSPVELIVSELGEGEILGELSVLRNQPRSATIVAVERTHCLVLPRSAFLKVLQSSADLAVSLLRTLAGRLYETDRRLSRLAPDPVTGLAGRRTFHDQYRRLAAVARRRQTGALLLVVDVLQLRSINDRFGYGVGDDVLRTVGDALVESTRSTDLVVRHGGDEFVVFFPDASVGDVDTLVARVRDTIKVLSGKRGIPVTIACNFGVAYAQAPPESAEDLLREADQDMLRRRR